MCSLFHNKRGPFIREYVKTVEDNWVFVVSCDCVWINMPHLICIIHSSTQGLVLTYVQGLFRILDRQRTYKLSTQKWPRYDFQWEHFQTVLLALETCGAGGMSLRLDAARLSPNLRAPRLSNGFKTCMSILVHQKNQRILEQWSLFSVPTLPLFFQEQLCLSGQVFAYPGFLLANGASSL